MLVAQLCIAASSSVPYAVLVLEYVVPAVTDTVTSVAELKTVIVPAFTTGAATPNPPPEAVDSIHLPTSEEVK